MKKPRKTYSGTVPKNATLIASTVGFRLFETAVGKGGWHRIKLIATGLLPKANWYLGCNGVRMSLTRDWPLLCDYWPEVAEWAQARAIEHCRSANTEPESA